METRSATEAAATAASAKKTHRDLLMKKIKLFKPRSVLDKTFIEIAEFILADNEIGAEHHKEEIAETITDMLPPIDQLFTREYFAQPIFALKLLKEVATSLYECLPSNGDWISSLDVPDQIDSKLAVHIWLAHAVPVNKEDLNKIVDRYKGKRRFTSSIRSRRSTPPASVHSDSSESSISDIPNPDTTVPAQVFVYKDKKGQWNVKTEPKLTHHAQQDKQDAT